MRSPPPREITVGWRVRLIALPNFVKTADPMRMLRPPTVLTLGAEGLVMERRSHNTWAIRFEEQFYLLAPSYLEVIEPSRWTAP
ncbi:MAG: NAD(P)H dehydrogenase assembly family protein [Cyanophyceae cyanobacterium]